MWDCRVEVSAFKIKAWVFCRIYLYLEVNSVVMLTTIELKEKLIAKICNTNIFALLTEIPRIIEFE